MTFDQITSEIAAEILRAEQKHGAFPADQIHCAAIVAEESGELVQAAIDHTYASPCSDRLREEAIQTAAMCFRFLMNPALAPETCTYTIIDGEGTYYAGCGLETDHVPASGICECKRQIVVERRKE